MNPGLVVKLRPSGPWRIGPDSGARNRVDVIYHSDSLFSAVTSAMSRMGRLAEWLDATARSATPAVCFSSCFPFIESIGFVVPPRTMWPPLSSTLKAAHVRWKSARFIPLTMVQSILAGERLDENRWSVDGPSGCLLPSGKQGPFRTSVRWGAAIDRLSGASERHSTACIEFRPGAGLWTVIGFADDAARDQWQEAIKAAFRLLADTGFGGERSRGWGRSEAPEFIEGELPGLIIGEPPAPEPEVEIAEAQVLAPPVELSPEPPVEPETAEAQLLAPPVIEPMEIAAAPVEDQSPVTPVGEPPDEDPPVEEPNPAPDDPEPGIEEPAPPAPEPVPDSSVEAAPVASSPEEVGVAQEETGAAPEIVAPEPEAEAPATAAVSETPVAEAAAATAVAVAPEPEVIEAPATPAAEPLPLPVRERRSGQAHWMLSLFSPAASDTVDWARGSYTLMARGGRVDSPAGSGELKKQIQMIAEGSVLVAEAAPLGTAPDVAPDGFAHPVFRAGFAMSIPLPEVH
jgi:CRISPR type III-A-associated RAMP protein Csm4